MAPITVLQPTSTQIIFQENVFSEQVVLEHAKRDVALLLQQARAKLPEVKLPHLIIHKVKIETDAQHQDKILEIYKSVVAQENARLKEKNTPIHMEITNGTGGSIYFAVANYEPIEKLHLQFPLTFQLDGVTQEHYMENVKGFGLAPEDEAQLLKIIPEIYRRASIGLLDLSRVTISKDENGNLKIEGGELDLTLNKETRDWLLGLILGKRSKVNSKDESISGDVELVGTATITVLRSMVDFKKEPDRIKTPQELASAMMAYAKGEAPAPAAFYGIRWCDILPLLHLWHCHTVIAHFAYINHVASNQIASQTMVTSPTTGFLNPSNHNLTLLERCNYGSNTTQSHAAGSEWQSSPESGTFV